MNASASRRILLAIAASLACVAPVRAADPPSQCAVDSLAPGFALGETASFEDAAGRSECRSRQHRGRHVAWIWRPHTVDAAQVFFACTESAQAPGFALAPG